MTRPQPPAIALPDPCVCDPMPARPRGRPMTGNPFVAVTDPSPISTQPHVSRRGRRADHFDARRGRRNHDHTSRIVALIGNHDAAGQHGARKQGEKPTKGMQTHVGNQLFLECRCVIRTKPRVSG